MRRTLPPATPKPLILLVLGVALAVITVGCGEDASVTGPEPTTGTEERVETPPPPPPVSRDALARRVQAFLDGWSQRETAFLEAYKTDFQAALEKIGWFRKLSSAAYEARGYALIFSDGQDLRPASDVMLAALDNVEAHGLSPEPYKLPVVHERLEAVAKAKKAYLDFLAPSEDPAAAELWTLTEKLRGELALSHEGIVMALGAADLDDEDVGLVDAAEKRLQGLFDAKKALNAALRDLDTALLQGFFRYGYDMRLSKRAHPFDADKDDGTGVERVVDELRALYDATDFEHLDVALKGFEPEIPEYRRMIEGLAYYQRLAAEVEHIELPKKAQRINKRSSGDHVKLLQQRLAQEGYLELEGEPDGIYGDALKEGIRLYQETHQLKQTGEMDKQTRSSLNKDFARRAEQVALGLRRHRESDLHQGERRYGQFPVQARVNIPSFNATFWKDGDVGRIHRVVVGSNSVGTDERTGLRGHFNRTRLFSNQLQTVVLNPTWRVPRRIKEEELDEKLMEEPDFYEKNNYEIVIKDDGTEEVVQLPGPNNALGLVKFLFPNKFSIYMHDTPKKRLFRREIRAFSHGCMRTQDALDLAKWLLTEVQEMTPKRFDQIVKSRETYGVALKNKIPITIDYNTVGVHESGRMMFFLDVYKFDRDYFAGKTPYPPPPREARFSQVVLAK